MQTIDDLIAQLQAVRGEHGNIPVGIDHDSSFFPVDITIITTTKSDRYRGSRIGAGRKIAKVY